MFQFLIGRLKTAKAALIKVLATAFQFLIGRLKTQRLRCALAHVAVFQFLIGRLKTHPKNPRVHPDSGFNSL